ncbi:chemotaxis protein CheW [Cohnella rhizosphaerae]|uniref:Chemotaxis protein CheW n=1 Tax=Cohnella rhizosphaerae TaxID=1457232 RepID=A0A9X4L036_9BACL|nr:chemotaxis protein CheW [Cohnella rhizosphaerae]MDG0811042.1 chemotaxis protein CheW [Cohnella rhizosphaerae]
MHDEREQYVECGLAGQRYAIRISEIQEIIRMQRITPLPEAPYYVQGITGLRGSILPVVCLRKLFGIPEKTEDKRTRIVVVQHGTASLGIIVDHVSSVLTFEQIQTTEGSLNRQQSSLIAIGKHADGLFGIISMDKVMESLYA